MRAALRAAPLVALALGLAAPVTAQQAAPAERPAKAASLPDWSGLWIPENDETSIGGLPQRRIDAETGGGPQRPVVSLFGFDFPWNAEGQRRQGLRRGNGNRKADGWGFPMLLSAAPPIQFLITPERTLIINGYRDLIDIDTRTGEHAPADDLWPTVWGDSVGHWEGDTLVVDTIMVKNPNEYFHGAPPLSEEARYVQRIRRTAPDRIESDITIEDPVTLTRPVKLHLVWVPGEGFDRIVYDIYDNDRTDSEDGTIAPPQD